MRGLEGKRFIVAGSATGIGAATARRLGAEGARVFLGDINIDGADLADAASIQSLVSNAVDFLGGLDGVANVAADLSPAQMDADGPLLEMQVPIWEQALRANLIGFALINKEVIPHLIESGGGSIVNTASNATFVGEAVRPAYAASKAGINTLSRHIASAYGDRFIRANSVSPGAVLSETAIATLGEDFQAMVLAALALKRLGKPDDLASTIAFLLSDDASWVSGQVWSVNGGGGFRE
jgi:NAD(P)-dependent dehydrogenase (short-subunit alcohol dehydrogenase family)